MNARLAPAPSAAELYPPGASPFRVKGNIYHGTQLFFAKEVAGGLDTLYAAIDDPRLREFIQQQFLPVALYDALPAAALVRAEAKSMGLRVPHYLRLRSAYQAERDISGVYRFLLKLANPEMAAMRLPRLVGQIFDFGEAHANLLGPGHLEGGFVGFPAVLAEWFSSAFESYSATALRIAGAVHARVTTRPPQPAGMSKGIELASITWEMRWR